MRRQRSVRGLWNLQTHATHGRFLSPPTPVSWCTTCTTSRPPAVCDCRSHSKLRQHLFLLDLQTLKRQYLFHWTCRLMPCMVGPIRSGALRPAHFASTPLRSVATELTPGSPAHWGPPSTFGLRLVFSIVWCHFMLGESVRRGYTYPGAPLKFDTNRPPYSHHHTCLWVLCK